MAPSVGRVMLILTFTRSLRSPVRPVRKYKLDHSPLVDNLRTTQLERTVPRESTGQSITTAHTKRTLSIVHIKSIHRQEDRLSANDCRDRIIIPDDHFIFFIYHREVTSCSYLRKKFYADATVINWTCINFLSMEDGLLQQLCKDSAEVLYDTGSSQKYFSRKSSSSIGATKHRPERTIFFRDEVSEGQLAEVLLEEVIAIRKACASLAERLCTPIGI